MSDSRLFKATRRSIRAEVTLIAVIVISFSWSAYALYKLALCSSDSFFDFGLSQSKPTQQQATQVNPSKTDHHNTQVDSRNLTEQLSIYKNQILKELLARQRQLLFDHPSDRYQDAQPEALDHRRSLSLPTFSVERQQDQIDRTAKPIQIEQLKQWRGGFEMPATLDYLFGTSKQTSQRSRDGRQVDRVPSSSNDYAQRTLNSTLIPLTDAPSLMQLSKFKSHDNHKSDAQTTRAKEFKSWHSDDELNEPSGDGARLHNQNASNDETLVTERQSEGESSTTSTIPPITYEPDSVETTTVEPTSNVANDETTPSPMNEVAAEGDSTKDEKLTNHEQESVEHPQDEDNHENRGADDDDNNDDDVSIKGVKKTVHAIDEEVDRMTQPSLGMASQQDKSFDYKNTVQFDDSLAGSIQRELDNDIKDKVPKSTDAGFHRHDNRPGRREPERSDEADLQVADNRSKLPIDVAHVATPIRSGLTKVLNMKRQGLKSKPLAPLRQNESPDYEENKKSIPETLIRTLEQKPNAKVRRREKRSLETNLIGKTLDSIDPKAYSKRNRKLLRRSDDQDESDEENQSESHEDYDQEISSAKNPSDRQVTPQEKLRSSYQTIMSNDPTIQELLAHKRLLDELQQSRVPSPVASPRFQENQLQPQQQRLNSSFLDSSRKTHGLMMGEAKAGSPDHQPADTHYTVDHGLLLYPTEDKEHHHKSMSKKSKKASHKKAKKKMMVAMKKGGHKKKKHKKEEKKYLKEKKFKGAKKGKKMSKGKGGKGGKKGKKYYKDKGFKKKGFKNIYVKNEFGQKKSYFDEFRDKDFKKKWKNFDDKYNYAQMKKWQAKDVKGAKKMKDQGENYKKYDKGKWKKKYHKHQHSESAKKKKKQDEF